MSSDCFGSTLGHVQRFQGVRSAQIANLDASDPNWKNPYSQQWALSLQRQISGSMSFDIAYTGNHALRLPYSEYYNTVNRVTGLSANAQFGTNFYYYQSIDASKYDALQAQFH